MSLTCATALEQGRVPRDRLAAAKSTARERWHTNDRQSYGSVLLFGLIPVLAWESIDALVHRVGEWLGSNGLVFVTCFTTKDPSYAEYSRQWARIGSHSYAADDGQVRTYLEPGRLPDLFADYRVVHHWEGTGPEHRHGDGDRHHHAMAEAVLRR